MGRRRIRLAEGRLYAVPLYTSGYGLILCARAKRGVALVYVFQLRFDTPGEAGGVDVMALGVEDACLAARCGDWSARPEPWVPVAEVEEWDRRRWPQPTFGTWNEVSPNADLVVYSDDDPSEVATLTRVRPQEAQRYPKDAVFGADALAMHITSLIDGIPVDPAW